jgi:hypothetical protein
MAACSANGNALPAAPGALATRPSPAVDDRPSKTAVNDPAVVPLPQGWWVVSHDGTNPRAAVGMAFRFEDMSYVVVRLDGKVDRRRCDRWTREASAWRCDGPLPLSVTQPDEMVRVAIASGELSLLPAPAARVAALDAAATRAGDVIAMCNRAERCCLDAMPLLNATCNVELELADKSSTLACERFLIGMRAILRERRVDAPPACGDDAPP